MHIGYARVSTQDQDLRLQYAALQAAGCDHICADKASGATASRDGLTRALAMLRAKDSLVVWKLDRLGRSVKDLVSIAGELEQQGKDEPIVPLIQTTHLVRLPLTAHSELACCRVRLHGIQA